MVKKTRKSSIIKNNKTQKSKNGGSIVTGLAKTVLKTTPMGAAASKAFDIGSKFMGKSNASEDIPIEMPPDNDYPNEEDIRPIIEKQLYANPYFNKYIKSDTDTTIVNTKFRKMIEDKLTCDHTH